MTDEAKVEAWMREARRTARLAYQYEQLIDDHFDSFVKAYAGEETAHDAVRRIGEKYDLTLASEWRW